MKKFFLSFILSGAALCGSAQVTAYFFPEPDMAGAFFSAVSDNGRYVVGNHQGNLYLFDTVTAEMQIAEPVGGTGNDVADDGTIVGKFTDPDAIAVDEKGNKRVCEVPGIYRNGEWTALERHAESELTGDGWDGNVACVSADGRYAAGCLVVPGRSFFYQPVIWKDGKIKRILPGYKGGVGARALSMSNDGKVACGWNEDSMYGNVMIWKDGQVMLDKEWGRGSVVSPGGYFVGGAYDDGAHRFGVPFIWSAAAGLVKIDYPGEIHSGGVTAISDNGRIILGYVNYRDMTDHHMFIVYEGKYYSFDEWMSDMYEVECYGGTSFFTATSMSADGRVICGFCMYDRARCPWILVFDEPLAITAPGKKEALADVSMDAVSHMLEISGEYTWVSIYDYVGRCVLSGGYAGGAMDVSQLPQGMYIVKVKTDGKEQTFKVVVPA